MNRLKILRKIFGFTQEQLAGHMSINRSTLAGIELGYSSPGIPSLQLLTKSLGVNLDWLTGKNVSLYSDWEKGLAHIKNKAVLSRWEILFLLEVIQYSWSLPSLQWAKTRYEHFLSPGRILLYFADRYKIHEDLVKDIVLYITKLWTGEPVLVSQANLIVQSVISFLKRDDIILTPGDEQTISAMLLPWGYYVALSYLTIKNGLSPVSSVLFSNLQDVLRTPEVDESFVFKYEREPVFFEYKDKKFIINFKNDYITLSLDFHKAFGVLATFIKSEVDVNRKVLDYEIFIDSKTGNVQITHHDIRFTLVSQNYANLINVLHQIITDNPFMWLAFQKACLEKYGFI